LIIESLTLEDMLRSGSAEVPGVSEVAGA
jgi:hypothetical protein